MYMQTPAKSRGFSSTVRDATRVQGEKIASVNFVRGDASGLAIPAHADALRAAGVEFLTTAFHRFGSLTPSNRVTRIARCESFHGGNSGHKLLLSVEYAREEPSLLSDLFVKFSRDFNDAFRDRRRYELEGEVRLARLSCLPGFPVKVPIPYFGDFNHESGTGILIAEQIAFGVGDIEPLRAKCMDHELEDPLEYYRATVTALARLAAAHKCGALAPLADDLFPFDVETSIGEFPIPYDERGLLERVSDYAAFASTYPQLLPENISAPQFIARFQRDAVRYLQHEQTIKRFLHADSDFIALCHWNTNIDNAWFWRDVDNVLRCGLLDWGMVRQMNVATALWGGLCGASLQIWDRHFDELLAVFRTNLHAHGGPRLDIPTLKLHLNLSVAVHGLALLMNVPSLVLKRLPAIKAASGPQDPIMLGNEMARSFLHVFTAFLNLWEMHDFGRSLDQMLALAQSEGWSSERDESQSKWGAILTGNCGGN